LLSFAHLTSSSKVGIGKIVASLLLLKQRS
jgi:hypothetical protein